MGERIFRVRKSTANTTDEGLTIKDAELPSTITVWNATPGNHSQKLVAAITIDVGTVQLWGPDGKEVAWWYHKDSSIESA